MRKYTLNILFAVLFAILFLSACGGNRDNQTEESTAEYTDTLSVLALGLYEAVLRHAADEFNSALAEEGRSFRLDLTTFEWEEREYQRTRLQTMIMAGQGYDIIIWNGIPLWTNSDSGLFADFNELIEQNPNSSRDDFFTHVLDAWELRGGLYMFPLSFDFIYVAINASLPPSIIEQFTQYSSITIRRLLEIYIDLQTRYRDDFWHMTLGENSFLQRLLADRLNSILGGFIDFDNRTSSLNDGGFALFLESWNYAFDAAPDGEYWNWHMTHPGGATWTIQDMRNWLIERCVFVYRSRDNIHGWHEVLFGQNHFLHFIPLACEDGRLIIEQFIKDRFDASEISEQMRGDSVYTDSRGHWLASSPGWGSVSISAGADGALAWDFTQQLLSTIVSYNDIRHILINTRGDILFHRWYLSVPIQRSYFEPSMIATFGDFFRDPIPQGTYSISIPFASGPERTLVFEEAIARLESFKTMPVVLMPYIPSGLYESQIQDFLSGLLTAQEVADIIHNRIALWLIE